MKAMILMQADGGEVRLPFNKSTVVAVESLLNAKLVPEPDSIAPTTSAFPIPTAATTPPPTVGQAASCPLRRYRTYSDADVHRCVRYFASSGKSVDNAALDLGIPRTTLLNWVRRAFGTSDRAKVTREILGVRN